MLSKNKRPYDPEDLPPRTRLRRNVQDIASSNHLSMARSDELCRDVNRLDPGSFADIARSSAAGSKSNRARALRGKFRKKVAWMPVYWAQVRTKDVKTEREHWSWLAFNLPHEYIAILKKLGVASKLLAKDDMDPLTLEHLLNCERDCGAELMALGLWGDGAPCNWDRTESIDVLTLSFPGIGDRFKNMRLPITAISDKNISDHTWDDIFVVLKWSLEILATGQWPTCRHDGAEWRKSDSCRRAQRPLLRAALCEVRADWSFLNGVFKFPAHNTKKGMCWSCHCKPEEVIEARVRAMVGVSLKASSSSRIDAACMRLTPGECHSMCVHFGQSDKGPIPSPTAGQRRRQHCRVETTPTNPC